ncbi:hypothetical protein VSDG_05294 [Cytospora chrysosperma]|uniref:ShKT domain-containing protein n=1 Tax=Cytospora chrysosperma TaxID=252740 RepID=A0A423VWX3_CYTCH|nr:hypothetical protein VSDG_05294 [Valsa sordida]
MALFKAYIISGVLLVGSALGYPQATSEKPTLQPTPPPAKDGSPRPACEHMHQCYPWALDECQEARDMGLFIKAYCYDNYCYAICPPVFPGTLPDEIATLPPPDNIYRAEKATATIMNANQDTTFTFPLEPPVTA